MKLKVGFNKLSRFGKEFEDNAYCFLDVSSTHTTLWLSLIMVKRQHRRKGALTRLLADARAIADRVLVPTPSIIVAKAAAKQGYAFKKIWVDNDQFEVMIWEADK